MNKTRCKMKCVNVTEQDGQGFSYSFEPVYSPDENSENAKFFKFTPSGKLDLGCTNGHGFVVGKEYYIDISLAE